MLNRLSTGTLIDFIIPILYSIILTLAVNIPFGGSCCCSSTSILYVIHTYLRHAHKQIIRPRGSLMMNTVRILLSRQVARNPCLCRHTFNGTTTVRTLFNTKEAAVIEETPKNDLDTLKGFDARTGEKRLGRNFNYKMELTTLAKRLGYDIDTFPSLQTALTHRSANLSGASDGHNGRLAVLGRSSLVHYIQEYLYYTYPNMDAGSLLDVTAELTNENSLSELTNLLGITELLLTTVKPVNSRYKTVLSKSFSAVLGALYRDHGPLAARKMVHDFVIPVLKSGDIRDFIKIQHPIYALNEILRKQKKGKAETRLLKETGRLSHFPTFVMGVFSGDKFLAEGSGTSLSRAKHEAMGAAIRQHYLKELKNISLPSDHEASFK